MSTARVRKQDAYLALERLESYRGKLNRAEDEELKKALDRAIAAIRSKLFQALLDVQEFYVGTLDASLPESQKAFRTEQLANQWERHSPIPVQDREVPRVDETHNSGKSATEKPRMPGYIAAPVVDDVVAPATNHVASSSEEVVETIVLHKGTSGLGFSISGGVDNHHIVDDPGVFVTKILPGLPAESDGRLKMDDQILSVNGNSMENVSHAQAVQALKDAGSTVVLIVRHGVGLAVSRSVSPPHRNTPPRSPEPPFITVVLEKAPGRGLGFSIAGGQDNMHVDGDDGIFITKIIPGGAAAAEGTLSVGDRVIKVDEHSMVGILHGEAVSILKSTQGRVVLQLEKGALQSMGITPEPTSAPVQPEEQPDGTAAFTVDVQVTQAVEIEPYKMRKVTFDRPEGTGLGFNIIGGEENFGIFVSFVSVGGIADKSGLVRVGDQILEVNGVDLRGVSHDEAAKTLKTSGTMVELLLEYRPKEYEDFQQEVEHLPPPTPTGIVTTEKKSFYIRALHDFDAAADSASPPSSLSFRQGDIIHVLNAGSEEWWQAAIMTARLEDGPTGLIPSRRKFEKRLSKQKSVNFPKKSDHSEVGSERGERKRRSFKFSKKFPFVKGNKEEEESVAEMGGAEAGPVYEAVQLHEKGHCRPVIILGPLKDEINDMLVQEFPDEFAGCVPHTTRMPRPGEVDGRDYHFVPSVDQMESDIQAHLFIEAGRYKDNLYGTSIKAVRDVAEQGKHCILGVSGYAIRRLQAANLQPIAICIRPNSAQTIMDCMPQSGLTLEKAQEDYEKGLKIEQDFAEYFTAVIEGGSLSEIYEKVKSTISEQSGQHVWLPSDEAI